MRGASFFYGTYACALPFAIGIPTRCFKVQATAVGEGQLFRWGSWSCGICSKTPAVTARFARIFQKRLGKVFPHLPNWLKPHSTGNSPHFDMLFKPVFCLSGFFRSVEAFLPLKIIVSSQFILACVAERINETFSWWPVWSTSLRWLRDVAPTRGEDAIQLDYGA